MASDHDVNRAMKVAVQGLKQAGKGRLVVSTIKKAAAGDGPLPVLGPQHIAMAENIRCRIRVPRGPQEAVGIPNFRPRLSIVVDFLD